jgi:hypothetical protein
MKRGADGDIPDEGAAKKPKSIRPSLASGLSDEDSGSSSCSSWAPSSSDDEGDDDDMIIAPIPVEDGGAGGLARSRYCTRSKGRAQPIAMPDEVNAAMDKADEAVDDESDLSSDTSSDDEEEESDDVSDDEDEEDESDEEDDEYSDDDSFVTSEEDVEEEEQDESYSGNACSESCRVGTVEDDVFDNDERGARILIGDACSEDIPAILTRCDAGIDGPDSSSAAADW